MKIESYIGWSPAYPYRVITVSARGSPESQLLRLCANEASVNVPGTSSYHYPEGHHLRLDFTGDQVKHQWPRMIAKLREYCELFKVPLEEPAEYVREPKTFRLRPETWQEELRRTIAAAVPRVDVIEVHDEDMRAVARSICGPHKQGLMFHIVPPEPMVYHHQGYWTINPKTGEAERI